MTLVLILAGFGGLVLGLLGGGGSILTVPVLLYGVGLEAKEAIATSLLIVALISTGALLQYARSGLIHWRVGATFAIAGMIGAYGGGYIARFIPSGILLSLFAGMMLVTAVAMMRGKSTDTKECDRGAIRVSPLLLAEGLAVGLFTGMVGAGGGFLVVPVLVVLAGMPMKQAIATSLLVVSTKSLAGFFGYASHVTVDYPLAAAFSAVAIFGALAGTRLNRYIAPQTLRTVFAWFVVTIGLYVLQNQF